MTGKKIIYSILAAFIAGSLLLIYIQYKSAKNINGLIRGNEKVLVEFQVSSGLRKLEKDISQVERKIGKSLYTNDSSHLEGINEKMNEVERDLKNLHQISDDDIYLNDMNDLDFLVREKLLVSSLITNSINLTDKYAGNKQLLSDRDKELNDSILLVTHKIESSREQLLAMVTSSIDKSGKKALNFSMILIALVLAGGAGLFWYIINTISRQAELINQLNISEKKVKESARVKERFLANMSHEIRTPLNAIQGFTHLLQEKNMDKDAKEYVKTIEKSGENLLDIVNDILDLSKIEAGMMRIENAAFSIRGLVHSVETMFKTRAAEKHIELLVYVDESMPDNLDGDATRLTQILVNLIGNALKFTNSGVVIIKVMNEGNADSLIHTGITVSDTGIGIEKDKLATIFERFQQAEDSITRKFGGTGLGLAIVKDIVLLQQGTIEVVSEPGKGSSFHLMIPYHIAAESNQFLPTLHEEATSTAHLKNIVVLVAEDNEINQSLIKHLFSNWQLHFDIASNGKEAVDLLLKKNYDLILMDIQMPVMDGYTATLEIRNRLKLQVPIIAMTAHALAGEREKCISYGMNEYISKPIRATTLLNLINQFIQIEEGSAHLNKQDATGMPGIYENINLEYMKEVSAGNFEYEKTVTAQFIEAIPEDLKLLEHFWAANDIIHLRQVAHNMKTTLAVMGLNKKLEKYLDVLEYENINEAVFRYNFSALQTVCEASLAEAKHYLSTL